MEPWKYILDKKKDRFSKESNLILTSFHSNRLVSGVPKYRRRLKFRMDPKGAGNSVGKVLRNTLL